MLKRQAEEKRRQQKELVMQSQMLERQIADKTKRVSIVLEKILINECKKEKRMIQELSQKLRNENYK